MLSLEKSTEPLPVGKAMNILMFSLTYTQVASSSFVKEKMPPL
jgi:hypothetical protein